MLLRLPGSHKALYLLRLGSGYATSRVALLLFLVAAARILAVSDYGRFSYVLTVILLGQSLADAGALVVVTRHRAEGIQGDTSEWSQAALVRPMLRLQIIYSLLVGCLLSSGLLLGGRISAGSGAALVFAVFGANMQVVYRGLLRGRGRADQESVWQAGLALSVLLVCTSVGWWTRSDTAMISAYAAVQVAAGFGAALLSLSRPVPSSTLPSPAGGAKLWRPLLKESAPFNVMGTLSLVALRLDMIVVEYLYPDATVGLWAASIQVYQASWALGALTTAVMLPKLIQRRLRRPAEFSKLARQYIAALFGIGMVLATFVAAASGYILEALFGHEYAAAEGWLRLLAVGIAFVYLNYALGQILIAVRIDRAVLFNGFLGASAAGIGYPTAALWFGLPGLAVSVVVVSAIGAAYQTYAVLAGGKGAIHG